MKRPWIALMLSTLLLWQGSSAWAFHGLAAPAAQPASEAIATSALPCHDPFPALSSAVTVETTGAPCEACECCPWPSACKPAPALPVAVALRHRPSAALIASAALETPTRGLLTPPFRPPISAQA